MYPEILNYGPIHVYSYGLMMALAFIVTSLLLRREFERTGINPDLAHSITLAAIVCGIIGAKAYSTIESWNWNPFVTGILSLFGYGLLVTLGFFIVRFVFRKIISPRIESPELTNSITFTLAVGGSVGVIAYAMLSTWGDFITAPFGFLRNMMGSGLAWYGGLIYGSFAVLEVILRSKNPVLKTIDFIGPLMILGYAFGRMGCFLSGDGDYGPPSNLPWAMAFPNGTISTAAIYGPNVRVHPTPLYEVILCVAIFAFLWIIRKRKEYTPGFIFGLSLILIGIERIITEFWRRTLVLVFYGMKEGTPKYFFIQDRYDTEFAFYFGLSIAQIISIVMIGMGIWLIWRGKRVRGIEGKGAKG